MQEIVRVAKEERIIIVCTIHQPSTKVCYPRLYIFSIDFSLIILTIKTNDTRSTIALINS